MWLRVMVLGWVVDLGFLVWGGGMVRWDVDRDEMGGERGEVYS